MDLPKSGEAASRFSGYIDGLTSAIGHADRAKPLRDYCVGLMMPCERKSVEPMAAITAPERTAAQHQSLLHFVGEGNWSDEKVLAKVREMVLPEMERHGPIEAWIIDDTGFPKKGRHSVRVGVNIAVSLASKQLSDRSNAFDCQSSCELASSLSPLSAEGMGDGPSTSAQSGCTQGSYLQNQAGNRARSIAMGLRGCPTARCGADGCRLWRGHRFACQHHSARIELCSRIMPQTSVWGPGTGPWPPKKWSGHGRRPKLLRA